MPSGTRLVKFELMMASIGSTNKASADNLSFVIVASSDPVIVISVAEPVGEGWKVGFESHPSLLYELHRSQNLQTWTKVAGPTAGDGNVLMLADPVAPGPSLFYQVVGRRP